MKPSKSFARSLRPAPHLRTGCALLIASLALSALAYADRSPVDGVENFGRVTDNYFRGGEVTRNGLENLRDMGVRTVIDLTGKQDGEKEACRRLGIEWHSFPMDADQRPDDADVEQILNIVSNADEPVFIHCSAGKHRAGTIAALYRLRVQGWSPERTWAEQKSYGFGPAKDHRVLYQYVYGGTSLANATSSKSKRRHRH